MTRQKLIIVLLIVSITQYIFGQKISNIDFDSIKLTTQDSSSNNYYPLLLNRFQQCDTTLTETEYKFIYYGNIYKESYNPYGTSDNEKKFIELYKQEKFNEAIPYGQEVIIENPVNIKVLYKMLVCHHKLGHKLTAKKYADMYFPLLNVIYSSGDGKSIKTSYVVIKVSDEYEILRDLELTMTRQSLVEDTDVLTIETKGQKHKKGNKKIKSLYFNVSKPLGNLLQQFNKKE